MKTKNIIFVALLVLLTGMASCTKDPEIPTGKVFNASEGGNSGGGDDTSYEYVDLGLPSGTLWGTCNVGASSPEEYGYHFAWGEITTKSFYNWSTYKYCNGSSSSLTKYCNNSSYGNDGYTDNLTELQAIDDAASINWDSEWCIPTKAQWEELKNNTTVTWTTHDGVNGRCFTASNGNSLFLPAAGYCNESSLGSVGDRGYYWSSSLDIGNTDVSWALGFSSNDCGMYGNDRYYGQSIRAVRASQNWDYSKIILNELNGNDKFIEIYNSGDEAINLNGVYMEKDGNQNWIADNTVSIEAGGYLLLYCEDIQADHPEWPEALIFHSGISAKKNIRIQLFSPAGASLDDFNLVDIEQNDPAYIPAPGSYSRNANGTLYKWYYADPTPGSANVEGVVPVLGLEDGDTPVPPTPEEPDYTNIILNELNGETKFIEIYNKGTYDISLNGMYIMKDDYVAGAIWTADASIVAPAQGFVVLYSIDTQADHPELGENMFFNSGLSAKKTIRMTLFLPDGTERDMFMRGTTGEWGQTVSSVVPQSYARTPDGGDWKLADPTPGAANPATGENIPQE